MKEQIAEFDCFISIEPSKNLQLVNHCGIHNYNECNILSSKYKHKVPELQMIVEFPKLEKYCKSGFENTNTKIKTRLDETATIYNNFVIYFNGNECHFVPIARPILKSYICNVKEPDFKKTSKKDSCSFNENKNILEEFRTSCLGGVFETLSSTDKIRQVFVPADYQYYHGESAESKRRILLCYGRQKLSDLETMDRFLKETIKSMTEINIKNNSIVCFKKAEKSFLLETEIMNILIKYKIVKFNILMDLLRGHETLISGEMTERRVLTYLPTVSLMVRGYWVIKSEVLYIMTQGVHNFPPEVMIPVRDYVMCLFHEGIETTAKKIQSVTKIPSMEATEILEQFANRVTDPNTGKSHWQFKESYFEFILKHHDINSEQSRKMAEKKVEVCRAFKLQTLLGDACSSKPQRQRSMSSHLEFSDSNCNAFKRVARFNDLSPSIIGNKRQRLNSTPLDISEIEYNSFGVRQAITDNSSFSVVTESFADLDMIPAVESPRVAVSTEPVVDELITMMEHLKEEPVLSPKDVHNDCGYQNDEFQSCMKTEMSERDLTEMDKDRDETMIPECFPSLKLYEHMKNFMTEQFSVQLILPVKDLAICYMQDHLKQLSSNYYESWEGLDSEELMSKIIVCMCAMLEEYNASKIVITWPQISTSLPEQFLYLSVNKSVEVDRKFIDKLLELLHVTGSVTMTDIKKALSSDNEMKQIMPYTANILRDKVQRYCLYRHRKFFLKYTVS